MKVIFEGNQEQEKENKEKEIKNERTMPSYVVVNNNKGILKILGLIFLVVLSSFGGGYVATLVTANDNNGNGRLPAVVDATKTTYEISEVENPVVAIASEVTPSVVGIRVEYTSNNNLWGILSQNEGEGSGTIYSADGYIITNYHVIEQALLSENAKIYVKLAGEENEIEAKIVGHDKQTDLAVLKIEKTGLKAAEFGSSSDTPVGSLCVAIGNPLGSQFAGTVTVGYISAVNRSVTVDSVQYNLIQTDAAINSGNSGGALVNNKGEVIGINTAKISATGVEGMCFAIPIDDVLPIIEELINNKSIVRPYIGITGISLTEDVAKRYNLVEGVYVQSVEKLSPAELAGISQGDVIVEVNSTKVVSVAEINKIKNTKKIGDSLDIKIYTDGEYKTIKVVLASNSDINN